jgi:hypothetical protein
MKELKQAVSKAIMDLGQAIGLHNEDTERSPKVNAHYGVSTEKAQQITKSMICELIMQDSKHFILDNYFKDLTAEQRARVSCYAQAVKHYDRLMKHALEDKKLKM